MNINTLLGDGIKTIMETAGRFYLNSASGQKFMRDAVLSMRRAAKRRDECEKNGTHIPPFLIASIASDCNLRCAGCYAWANGGCGGDEAPQQMDATQWGNLFSQASDLGIAFILLAGGEPLLRRDVIEVAARHKDIIFPIFTNGTVIDDPYLNLFSENRNLIPVFSVEGNDEQTDQRRGQGVAQTVWDKAEALKKMGLLFGTSITVTTENMLDVTEPKYVDELRARGCGLTVYVEYVPAEENTEHLLLNDEQLAVLQERIEILRCDKRNRGMIMLSFPGDEEAMGGCLAAGRGFFHINASGGAEPCPFSPFSALSLKERSLLDILRSPFFEKVRELSALEALNHKGGCTLFQHKDEVLSALNSTSASA